MLSCVCSRTVKCIGNVLISFKTNQNMLSIHFQQALLLKFLDEHIWLGSLGVGTLWVPTLLLNSFLLVFLHVQSREFKYNRQAFNQKARSMTQKYAQASASGSVCDSQSQPQSSANPLTVLSIYLKAYLVEKFTVRIGSIRNGNLFLVCFSLLRCCWRLKLQSMSQNMKQRSML